MFSLAKFKTALVHVLGLGEDEAHQFVTAIEADLAQSLDAFRQQLVADFTAAVAEAKVDAEKLAEDIAAKLADLGKTAPPTAG